MNSISSESTARLETAWSTLTVKQTIKQLLSLDHAGMLLGELVPTVDINCFLAMLYIDLHCGALTLASYMQFD